MPQWPSSETEGFDIPGVLMWAKRNYASLRGHTHFKVLVYKKKSSLNESSGKERKEFFFDHSYLLERIMLLKK